MNKTTQSTIDRNTLRSLDDYVEAYESACLACPPLACPPLACPPLASPPLSPSGSDTNNSSSPSVWGSGRAKPSGQDPTNVRLSDYLPPEDHAQYLDIATELVRVDLEQCYVRGNWKRLEAYQSVVPRVFEHTDRLDQIAFEEYRLRWQRQEKVDRSDYQRRFSICTDHWPALFAGEVESTQGPTGEAVGARRENGLRDDEDVSLASIYDQTCMLDEAAREFPEAGTSFLGFDLVRELGRGTFGRVYLATQDDLAQREVVLKVSLSQSAEPQRLARLQHTNIMPIYSVHEVGNLQALCMPYFGETTLADLLPQSPAALPRSGQEFFSTLADRKEITIGNPGLPNAEVERTGSEVMGAKSEVPTAVPVSPLLPKMDGAPESPGISESDDFPESYGDTVAQLALQMAAGLAHAHQRGIIHRDLKPANILLTRQGVPMLLDFNLSDDVVSGGRSTLMVGGTLPYMAPEHLRAVAQGGPIDARCDIYSLGVMLFEMLTGTRPFANRRGQFTESVEAMIADRQAGAPTVRPLNPAASPAMASIVAKSLRPDPEDRYQTAAALQEDLQRHLEDRPLYHAANTSGRELVEKWWRRHRRLATVGLVATLMAILVGMGAMAMVRGRRVARLEAQETYVDFQEKLVAARLGLSIPDTEQELRAEGIRAAHHALKDYQVTTRADWRQTPRFAWLEEGQQDQVVLGIRELLYLLADGLSRQAESGNLETRQELLEQALQISQLGRRAASGNHPDQAMLRQLANLQAQLGDQAAAVATRQQADQATAGDELTGYLILLRRLAVGRVDQAAYQQLLPQLEELRDKHPQSPVSWLLLGNTQAGLHNLTEAEASYTGLIALQPKSLQGYFYRGLCRLDRRRYAAAHEDFSRVLQRRPGLVPALVNRALASRAQGHVPQALEDLSAALEASRINDTQATDPRIYFLRAQFRRQLGDEAGAEADRESGFQWTPLDDLGWSARGLARLPEEPEQASEDFRQGLMHYPQSVTLRRNLVHVLTDHLQLAKPARAELAQILTRVPGDRRALLSLAVLDARQGEREKALTHVRQLSHSDSAALDWTPTDQLQLACVYALTSRGQPKDARRALSLLRSALRADPHLARRARTDQDLKPLAEEPEFAHLLDAAEVLQ